MAIPTASAIVPRFDDVGHLGAGGFRTAEIVPYESNDVFINTSRGWINLQGKEGPEGPIGTFHRSIATHTTASLASEAIEKSVLEMHPGWRAFKFSTNRPARVRVYLTEAQRDADENRPIEDELIGNHGCLLEIVTSSILSYVLSPAVDFASDDVDSSEFYVSVTNLDSVAGTVVTTYDYIRTE